MTEPDPATAELEAASGIELSELVAFIESDLLGGDPVYTNEDIAQRSELSLEELRALWRALGFASVEDDDRAFTDADLDALGQLRRLQSVGEIDDDLILAMTRIMGQSFARLASWQAQLVVEIVSRRPELLAGGDDLAALQDLLGTLTPAVENLHNYIWRRQLAAVFARMASNAGVTGGAESAMVVGFVDMAGFTTLTRKSSEAELREVLTAFETVASDIVAGCRGQIVKTIGDEVLFVADTPSAAAEIALSLLERADADPVLPQVRAGLAFGPVVSRLGDVFGQTVNIASRLTSLAWTDSVLVDEKMSEALLDDGRWELSSLRPASVRGYSHLKSWRLRRTES